MMVEVGQLAPDFEAESTKGKLKLSDFKGKKVVLYFYPKSFTPGCTRELQRFVELYDKFVEAGAEVIGVSVDSLETQKRFGEKYGAKFPIVSDKDKKISTAYGVLNDRKTSAQRVTFIIDDKGIVRAILKGLKKSEEHADRALEEIKKL